MATIKNPEQVGKSIRNRAQMAALRDETLTRVSPKVAKMSTAKLIALLPRTKVDGRDNLGRRTRREAVATAVVRELRSRNVEITESLFGPRPDNRDNRGEYKEVPAY